MTTQLIFPSSMSSIILWKLGRSKFVPLHPSSMYSSTTVSPCSAAYCLSIMRWVWILPVIHRHGSISNIVQCYKSLYCMVVSRLKILLLKKQPTLIQYSLVQVYHKRGLIDSRYSVFFQEAAAACWITSSSRLSSGFPSCAKCSDTLIRTFPHDKILGAVFFR